MFLRIRLLVSFALLCLFVNAQNGFRFYCTKDTTVAPCGQGCATLSAIIPDIHGQSNTYTINKVAGSGQGCFYPYVAPNNTLANSALLTLDDRYGPQVDLGFTFTFFGSNYTKFFAGSNGMVSFDPGLASSPVPPGAFNNWVVSQDLPTTEREKASIMGPIHDIDISVTTSPDRKAQYQVIGTAPHRRWILSFYKIPLYSSACHQLFQNTHQIILYEGTGIVEVFIYDKEICTGWNNGKAMVGMQDETRTLAVMAPGRKASDPPWGSVGMNEMWRFVPNSGVSLLKRVELVNLATNTIVATVLPSAVTNLGNGTMSVSFPNICSPTGITSYLVRPVYKQIDKQIIPTAEIFGADTIRVTRPAGTLAATATTTSATCATGGTVTVNVSATGVFQYRIDGGAWQNSNIFLNIPTGPHTAEVIEVGGSCTASIPVNVDPANPLKGSVINGVTSCPAATDGTVTVIDSTGTAPFEYKLGSGAWQSSNVFTGLAVGSYQFYIRDINGCTSNAIPGTVTAGPAVAGTASATTTSCLGASNATVTVSASGTGSFQYSMNPAGPWQVSNVFPGLASGSYNFYIKLTSDCISSGIPVFVNDGPRITGGYTSTPTSCLGASDGAVTINSQTGTGPFEYRMGTAGTWQSSNVFSPLAAGSYNFYMRNAAGCETLAIPADVLAGNPLQANGTATNTSCTGATDGSITVSNGNGSGPFEYRIGSTGIWQSSPTFTGLAANSYDVYIRNAAGCISPAKQVQVNAGAALQGNATSTATSCNGATDGTITVTAPNGTGPFEYRIGSAGTWQSSAVFTGLAAGSYDVYIRNAAGCMSSLIPASVAPGSSLQGYATAMAPSCSGAANGSVTVSALSGNPPFEYRMGTSGVWQSSSNFTGLLPGPYTFYIRTSSGCISAGIPATVPQGTQLTASSTKTDVTCFAGNNGTVTITPAASGMPPFSFSSDNFNTQQPGNQFAGLAANNYTFYFKDAAGCSGSVNSVVSQPTQLSVSIPAVVNVKCNGGNDGKITLSASGGTAPYQYSLNGGPNGSSNSFTVPAGSYNAVITDANGCTTTRNNIVVTEPAALSLSVVQAKDATCNGGANGIIQLSGTGGTSPYKFKATGSADQASPTFNVNPGSYSVGITDVNNCVFNAPAPVNIGLTNDMAYTPIADKTICQGESTLLQTQTNATQFLWSGPAISNTVGNPSAVNVQPAKDTFYTVTATYGRCAYTDTVNVFVSTAPIADAGPGNTICFGKSDTLSASGGVTYEWSPSTYLTGNTNGPDPVVAIPQKTITYTLYVRDANNCRSLEPSTVTINVTPQLVVLMSPPDTIGYFGDSIHLHALSIGSIYAWSPTVGLSNANIADPVVFVTQDMIYKVMATTAAGCSGEGTFKIRAYKGPDIYVPTAFTPNGDGLNDRVRPFSVGIETLNYFRVFDRWGQLMYEYKGEKRGPVVYNMLQSNIGWDGNYNGRALNTGTFVWVAEGLTLSGKKVFRKGTVTLIR
jgi:gliding motility-associated-like protein